MASNKQSEMNDIHRTIWAIANELRGTVDGWDFKAYVLGTIFYKYISQNLTDYINQGEINAQIEAGVENPEFDYTQMSNEGALMAKEGLIQEKGFFLLPSQLFQNVLKTAKENENLNVDIANIFKAIEDSTKGTKSEKAF